MIRLFETHLPRAACEWPEGSGGMFLWVRIKAESHPDIASLQPAEVADRVFQRCISQLVLTAPSMYFKAPGERKWTKEQEAKRIFLRLCFATPTTEEMEEGVKRLARALKAEWKME